MADDAHARAADSISASFTRVMNATTSRWGLLTDPSIVGFTTAPLAIAALASARLDAAPSLVLGLEVLLVVPALIAISVALGLRGARVKLVDWLAAKPFPIENMNAVLNGLGEELEVTFAEAPPPAKDVNLALDAVSPDCFVSSDEASGRRTMDLRIGVVDSKRNPSVSNHLRFLRVREIVDRVLVPLAGRCSIAEVRVK